MKLKGKAFKFGNDVNTDEIIPARYLNTIDPTELAKHCMEDADPGFVKKIHQGDIIVAGDNFGCGSSREHAPIAIKGAGVSCVIAKSFARIFYRNAINTGLPIFTSSEASDVIKAGDRVEVNTSKGEITKQGHRTVYKAEVFSGFINEIINSGGLIAYANPGSKTGEGKVEVKAKVKEKEKEKVKVKKAVKKRKVKAKK